MVAKMAIPHYIWGAVPSTWEAGRSDVVHHWRYTRPQSIWWVVCGKECRSAMLSPSCFIYLLEPAAANGAPAPAAAAAAFFRPRKPQGGLTRRRNQANPARHGEVRSTKTAEKTAAAEWDEDRTYASPMLKYITAIVFFEKNCTSQLKSADFMLL